MGVSACLMIVVCMIMGMVVTGMVMTGVSVPSMIAVIMLMRVFGTMMLAGIDICGGFFGCAMQRIDARLASGAHWRGLLRFRRGGRFDPLKLGL